MDRRGVEEALKQILREEQADLRKGLSISGGGSKDKDATSIGGRAQYRQPLDDKSAIEIGLSGHYAKGKNWKDAGLDYGDLTYEQKLDKNDLLRASLGAGRGGVDSGFISYEKEFKKGGKVKKSTKPKVRGHGIEKKGKTKGRFV